MTAYLFLQELVSSSPLCDDAAYLFLQELVSSSPLCDDGFRLTQTPRSAFQVTDRASCNTQSVKVIEIG